MKFVFPLIQPVSYFEEEKIRFERFVKNIEYMHDVFSKIVVRCLQHKFIIDTLTAKAKYVLKLVKIGKIKKVRFVEKLIIKNRQN